MIINPLNRMIMALSIRDRAQSHTVSVTQVVNLVLGTYNERAKMLNKPEACGCAGARAGKTHNRQTPQRRHLSADCHDTPSSPSGSAASAATRSEKAAWQPAWPAGRRCSSPPW